MTCSNTDQTNVEVKIPTFKGPAGEIFDSFQEQASYFLDTYWPNWKNYDNPKSYMIPPTFKYKHAEVSDQNFEKFRQYQEEQTTRTPHEIISDRQADEAEFMVSNVIQHWIEDGIGTPFIAIRNLNLNLNFDPKKSKLNGLLTEIFPDCNWDKFREILKKPNAEFDFLLIGPKIGIAVFEVKSSNFKNHFNEEAKFLPNDYKEGLKQLESIDGLIYLLQECTGLSLPNENCITKILFTPNLEKERYENWLSNLTAFEQQRVKERVGTVFQWYKKEEKVEFASKTPMSTELYEKYAPAIAAMASIISLSTNNLGLNKLNFSEYEMAVKENEYLVKQNLVLDRKNKQIAATSLLQKAPKEVQKYSNVYFLTPDQQKALQGPPYQFIFGAAGTGKTIVLQAKACELLAKGESVALFSAQGYMVRYRLLFDNYGFTNYKLYELFYKTWGLTPRFTNYMTKNFKRLKTYDDLMKCIDYYIQIELQAEIDQLQPKPENPIKLNSLENEFERLVECLVSFDNILIDDAADGVAYENYISYFIMRYVQNVIKKNLCWAAIDPCFGNFIYNLLINKDEHQNNREDISITILKQVMRCSEEIYKRVYIPSMDVLEFPSEVAPVSGHKIQGSRVTKITQHFPTHADALTELWAKIETEIDLLINHGIGLKNIAIIVTNDDWDHADNVKCQQFLADQCEQRWPNRVEKSNRYYEMTSNTDLILNYDSLLITKYTNVSSFEWPVVININLLSKAYCYNNNPKNIKNDYYYNYRAMSRATAKLIDITFTCEECSREYAEWSSSELNLLIDLFKKYSHVIKNTVGLMDFYEYSTEEKEGWENIFREFYESVEEIRPVEEAWIPAFAFALIQEQKRQKLRQKLDNIFYDCNNYAHQFIKPEKPRYFDIFNEIYGFFSDNEVIQPRYRHILRFWEQKHL